MHLLRFLLAFLLLYGAFTLYAYFFADSNIFFPPKSTYQDNKEIIKIPSKNGALISALYLPNPNATYTILVSHGNAEDLGVMYKFLQAFQTQGYAVFAYDYQGYGTSQGKPTEKNSYADEMAAYEYLTNQLKIDPQHIIAYGRSLGAALAVDLAAKKPIGGLIIESGFTSAFRVVFPFPLFFFDKYNNLAKIKQITCPILFIYGTKDTVISSTHSEKLYQAALSNPKMLYAVPGGGHNNLLQIAGSQYWEQIKKFTQQLKT